MSAMDFDLHEYYARDYRNPGPQGVMSTAGAVPEVNDKGEVTMKKVKVQRYVTGKRPDYAQESSDDDEDEPVFQNEGTAPPQALRLRGAGEDEERDSEGEGDAEDEEEGMEVRDEPVKLDGVKDRRLDRMRQRQIDRSKDKLVERIRDREITKPEIIEDSESESDHDTETSRRIEEARAAAAAAVGGSESEEDDLEEDEIERRRRMVLERARERQQEERDLLDVEEEEQGSEDSEYSEEYTDSEDDVGPRLKPVFVRKTDRITLQEREAREQIEEQKHETIKARQDNRKKESHALVEQIIKEELATEHLRAQAADSDDGANIITDDENEAEEYESWKVRELRRIKTVREAREAREREAAEIEKVRNMTEDERKMWSKMNPKQITNKADKGKYRFLQKYYHRGAFYIDNEEGVLKQDFSKPTLEDHFDKSILPKVMQVKNFGRSGRTKYTHLLDQDTTNSDSPWAQTNQLNTKFQANSGGTKLNFTKPSSKKR